jgi:hypothetical protein
MISPTVIIQISSLASWASTVTGAPTIISTATVGALHHAREAKSPFIFFETSARVEGHCASDIAARSLARERHRRKFFLCEGGRATFIPFRL